MEIFPSINAVSLLVGIMTFEEWLKENDVDRDEYYSIGDMRWFAEQAWNAAVCVMKGQTNKTVKPTAKSEPVCKACGVEHTGIRCSKIWG